MSETRFKYIPVGTETTTVTLTDVFIGEGNTNRGDTRHEIFYCPTNVSEEDKTKWVKYTDPTGLVQWRLKDAVDIANTLLTNKSFTKTVRAKEHYVRE